MRDIKLQDMLWKTYAMWENQLSSCRLQQDMNKAWITYHVKFLGRHIKWKIPIVKIRSCNPREALSYNDAWRISNELRSSFYLAHYLICRGGEFGSLIFNPQLSFNSILHDASLLKHPKPCQASKFPVVLVWRLSFSDPNLLRAIHGMNNIHGHPNRPVPSICSPPHDMS